jgi:CRP-like cAMP-binding protein
MNNGDTVEVATVGRQGMLGVSVLLGADPAPYHMVCHIPGEAGRMKVQQFMHLADELPSFRRQLLRYGLWLFHEAARTAACNRLHTVQERLARWLLLCGDQAGSDVYPLTHETLARMIRARRPYITRTLRDLKLAGLVQYRYGMLRILDRTRLHGRACEDYQTTLQVYSHLLG